MSALPLALILGVQKKFIMLIQHAEKKENSSSKRYEMNKLSFGDAIWWLIEKLCLPHFTLFIIFIEIPDDAQMDVELYSLPNALNQLLYNLTLEIYAKCYFLPLLLQTTAFAK